MISEDPTIQKRQFIELYYHRKRDDTPQKLMQKIGLDPRQLTDWLEDQDFQRELDKIDNERAWMAREIVFRRIDEVFNNMVQMAVERTRQSTKAAEMMLKVTGVLASYQNKVAVQVNAGDKSVEVGGMDLDELTKKRDEIKALLASVDADDATFEEDSDGTRLGDPEEAAS